MKTLLAILTSALTLTATARAETFQPAVVAAIEQAQADCESYEAGNFSMEEDATTRIDLTGNGQEDWVVDTSRMACSSAASMYCGTGGCGMTFVAQGAFVERIAGGWEVVTFAGRPVILLDVHGSLCGGINPTPCVEALIWDAEARNFQSVAPRAQ